MKNPFFTGHALSKAEMKGITGGSLNCIPPDDPHQMCLLGGAITSCLDIPCCCGFYCNDEWNGSGFDHVCRPE